MCIASGTNMMGISRDTPGCSRIPCVRFKRRQKFSEVSVEVRLTWKWVGMSRGLVNETTCVVFELRLALMVVGGMVEGSEPLPWRMNTCVPNCACVQTCTKGIYLHCACMHTVE